MGQTARVRVGKGLAEVKQCRGARLDGGFPVLLAAGSLRLFGELLNDTELSGLQEARIQWGADMGMHQTPVATCGGQHSLAEALLRASQVHARKADQDLAARLLFPGDNALREGPVAVFARLLEHHGAMRWSPQTTESPATNERQATVPLSSTARSSIPTSSRT